jgi:hypothetical protein
MGKGDGKVTEGDIKREVGASNLAVSNLRGGRNFPIRYGKVTRVDPKRMVVDLVLISQTNVDFTNVPITFPGAGARHFFGAMPEVGDICLIGQQPAESGRSKRPVILGWYVPSTQAGYDWLNVRSHGPDELDLTPKQKVALDGIASERRHKLRQMEAGNVVASSSQGADLLLTESATLTNRRGNEVILRDQDQALVVRSLQQFHAGAGFRTYSGMVQRDANLLPTQVVKDSVDWTSDRQVDGEVAPLDVADLDENEDAGSPQYPSVFSGLITTEATDPTEALRRGLFLDLDGNFIVDPSNDGASVYGGKKVVRVAADMSGNATARPGVETFSEYRVEVAHTSTGILPVTEQTDGIDIDRLLTTPPSTDDEATGGNQLGTTDPTLLSPNSPMVEFVLGTAVGNDYTYKPEEYGLPLVAKVTTESGEQQTVVRAYDPKSDTLQDQLAFLIRSRDPEDPSKESFVALTKGGAWLTSFQGQGSKVNQENLRTGKVSFYGADADGQSRVLNASGAVSIKSLAGRPADNVGVEIKSDRGAVSIYGGGPNSEGAADGSSNDNSPSNAKMALKMESANGAQLQAAEQVKITAPEINLTENKTTNVSASSAFNVNAGDAISMSSKTLGMTINGAAEYVFGGPLNGLATNGATRSVSFTGTPATGALGGSVDDYKVTFGGRSETFRVGRDVQVINAGMLDIRTMGPGIPAFTPGAGLSLVTGLPLIDNGFGANPVTGTSVGSKVGVTSMKSAGGPVSISGTTGTFITSLAKTQISAPYVNVIAPLSPFGGVLTDGCLDSLTGRPFLLSGTIGAPTFRVGP